MPRPLWERAVDSVLSYGLHGRGHETLVYLAGVAAGDELIVTTLYILDHNPQGDRVVVTPDEARWLVRQLRDRDEKLVAQIHSHRGGGCHSRGDDAYATSFHDGYLSIVVPAFGIGVTGISHCTVVEFDHGAFRELGAEEVERRLHVTDTVVHRLDVPPVHPPTSSRPGRHRQWQAFGRRLRSIARRRRWPDKDSRFR